jgi:drug/metabolite transporter (DMT)-like permease
MGTFGRMRRPTRVELMLLVTIVLWALNLTVTRYVLTHGLHPLAYATLRYGAAAAIFVGLTLALEGTFGLLFAFATLGPLVLTNVLWFRSLHHIGPARATLAANLQPFVAVVFAVVLLSESMTAVQVGGGVLIALGIVLARRRPSPPVTAPTPLSSAAPAASAGSRLPSR